MARSASVTPRPVRASGGGSNTRRLALWLALAVIVILIDQLTKTLILGSMQLGDSHTITSYFNIVRVHNTGAAFSFLAGASGWQRWFFITLGIVVSIGIVWMIRSHPDQKLFCFSVTMIMGGALGNVIDRMLHGYVVDFLQFHWPWLEPLFRGGYFPSFNVADAAITLGAVCLVLDELLRVRRAR
jgi:signal peptidase II